MKRLSETTFILSCVLYLNLSFSQNKDTIDSLQYIIKTQANDTVKVNALNELAWELHKTDASRARSYAGQAVTLSDSLAFKRGWITGWVRLGQIAFAQKQYEEAEQIYLYVLEAEKEENYQYGIGRAQSALSEVYRNKGDLKKALDYSLEALKTFETLNKKDKKKLIALVSNNIGAIYEGMGSYDEALDYLLRSLKIRLELGDKREIGLSLLNIGSFYNTLENYTEAIKNLDQSKTIFETLNDHPELAKVYNNLGTAHFKLGHYKTALRNYNKSISLKKQLRLEDNDPVIYNNLGTIYYQKKDLDTALSYYLKSIRIHKDNTDGGIYHDGYINAGDIYYLKNNYKDAIMYYRIVLVSAEKLGKKTIQLKILNGLSRSYERLEQYDSAFIYNNRYIKLNNSIDKTYKKAVQLKADYEEQQKEKALLEKDKEILASKNKRRENLIISLLAGIVLLAVLFFAILKIRQQKQRIRLAEKDRQIKIQKIEDLLKNQELKFKDVLIEGQEKERKRIAKDLHDSLGSMLSTVKMYFKNIEENIENLRAVHKEQYEKANDLLDNACKEVRKIAYNMNEGVLVDFGLLPALKDLKDTLEEADQIKIDIIHHGLTRRLDNHFEISLYKIIQELINNILKHAEAGKIIVQLIKGSSRLKVMVEDDGVGFNAHHKKTSGMGLANVASRVEILEGELHIDSTPGKGTIITIYLPLIND